MTVHATDPEASGVRPTGLLGDPALRLGLIWAQAHDRVIGAAGTLAWHVPEDLRHFRDTTRGYAVIHGRASYEALPGQFRPLPGRRNIILTRQTDYVAPGAEVVGSLDEAIALLDGAPAWVCGGGQVYAEAINRADVLLVTEIDLDVEGDTHAPPIGQAWALTEESPWHTSATGTRYQFTVYRRQ